MIEPTQDNQLVDFTTFRGFLFDAIVPIEAISDKDGEPISKILVYWRKKNLVPFIPSGKHTFHVSFSDVIWFRILDIMRDFSYPIEKMKQVCDYFFKDAYFDELPKKNFLYHQQLLSKKKLAGTLSKEESETLAFIETSLNNEDFLYALRFEINYLTNLIMLTLSEREEKAILIFGDGLVGEQHGTLYYTHRTVAIDSDAPHLFISIKHLLAEFVNSEELEQLYMPAVLSEKEREVWRALKDRRIKEITIVTQEGEIKTMEVKKGELFKGEDSALIKSSLGLKNYEKITVKTVDNSTLYVETTSRIIR
jgi:hypothetical protein